jgi:S-adenosylmethionine/arginine decarboxylase-like enzyme
MIKNKFSFLLVLFTAFVLNQAVSAQSDYDKTQNFKNRYKQLEDAIKNAASIDECNVISENIVKLKEDFTDDIQLLDKSLYPDNYGSSFSRIERALEIRKGDFNQIVDLRTEVGSLKDKVSEISQTNAGLLVQIKQLNIKVTKDAQTIASLQKLVSQLKANIAQRDELVRGIVDSLLEQFVKTPSTLNEAEKQAIFKRVDNGNLFFNIERTISDNVQYMKVTQITPDDLSKMKAQYKDFNKVWRQIGPKLSEIYLDKKDKSMQIANIDNMFGEWSSRIDDEMWGQINKLFREKKLAVLPFKSGDQFYTSVNSFIDDEIKNLNVKSSAESKITFHTFADSVYFKTIQPVWIPILVENKMMSTANKDSIEKRIGIWKDKVAPAKTNVIYIGLGAVIFILIVLLILKGKKKKVVIVQEPPKAE